MIDERLNNILSERDKAILESNNTYQGLIDNNQNLYNQQLDYIDKYETEQNKIAQSNYETTQNQINQNKEQARKDTDIENQKAYNSYQKLINPYGTDMESLGGLNNSGYSETFKLGGYNAYQNRVGKANEAYRQAVTQYDLEMAEAKQNYDVTKAQNALAKLQMGLEYAQSYNDNNSNLTLGKLNASQSLNTEYDNRYTTMMNQINTEKQLAEQIRQFNEQMAYQKQRDAIEDAKSSYSGSGGGGYTLTEDDETPKITKTSDELSKQAQAIYVAGKTAGVISRGNTNVKNNVVNAINQAYQNGEISQNDVRLLIKKLGLD